VRSGTCWANLATVRRMSPSGPASRSLACCFLLLATAACNNDGGGGGGLIDHGACDLLIECASTLAPEARDSFIATYGNGGTCWQGGPSQWAACKDACRQSLDALNQLAELTGEACGTCQTDADCAAYGVGTVCDAGLCLGGGVSDGETGDSNSSGDGDGDPGVPLEAVSILLVVDNSASMSRAQRILATRAHELIDPLDTAGIPWRLGITTTDNGNPWCPAGSTTPEAGNLVLSSCATRLADFLFNNGTMDSQDYSCLDICHAGNVSLLPSTTPSDPVAKPRPWIESVGGVTNLDNITLENALPCLIPQGINGCGFESQLYSAQLTVARSGSAEEDEYGFVEPGRLLVVIFVTDETDCSFAPDWAEIFDENGNKEFWSDPSLPYPTSAVCWNAGMQCTGDPADYDDCVPIDLDVNGVITDNPDAAVLRPVAGIIEGLGNPDAVRVFGIVGVDDSGQPRYADHPDYQDSFGIGPGCQSMMTTYWPGAAVPPGRIWTVLEQLGPSSAQQAYSICADDFDNGLPQIGQAIAAEF
jgi:hypothetical protein